MKKVLFATSALVASAGFAAADVSISGYAEMGITGGSDVETLFHQDVEVTFTMSGTTDNGLTFGTSVQLDEGGGVSSTGAMLHSVFISGSMGTLTLGDTDGALDWAMDEVPVGSGSIADNQSDHSGWNGNAGLDNTYGEDQVLRYDNTVGGLGYAVSIELDDTAGAGKGDPVIGLGLRYSMGDLGIGLGYQSTGTAAGVDREAYGVSLRYSMGDITLGANYSVISDDNWTEDQSHMGIGMSYSMDAITVGINYGSYDNVGGSAAADRSGIGISAGYDLGGGASILLGYENTTDHETAASEDSTWSLGLAMSF